jgi:hypothetical protein
MEKGIIVLGMHRSGTSLVADIVHRWGAFAGDEEDLLPADDKNANGYWEYAPLVTFDNELLISVESNWFIPPSDDSAIRGLINKPGYRHKGELLIEAMEDAGLWFWKDPRLSLLLPFWQQIWDDVATIIVVRNPLDIVKSLHQRDIFRVGDQGGLFSEQTLLLLWQHYTTAILRNTAGLPNTIFVRYEALLANPEAECRRLADFLAGACGVRAGADGLARMAGGVDTRLNHHKSPGSFFEDDRPTDEQKRLYRLLLDRVEDRHVPYDEERYTASTAWHQYLESLPSVFKIYYATATSYSV